MAILQFHQAVQQHHKWLEELQTCLRGDRCELKLDQIIHDNGCVIGQWLHGEGQQFAHLTEFQNVLDLHKRVHDIAGAAWGAKQEGALDQIEALLIELDEVKHEMFMAWNDLNTQIGSYD